MIAAADFCRPTMTTELSDCFDPLYHDDSLVPGADPYIAQLVAEHQAELIAQLELRARHAPRRSMLVRSGYADLAVA